MELLLLCIKIFCVRIMDVSLGTMRMIVTVKGKAIIASLIGFVEVFIWFVIVKEALNTDSTSLWVAASYAGGYATGTFVGSMLSKTFKLFLVKKTIILYQKFVKMVLLFL